MTISKELSNSIPNDGSPDKIQRSGEEKLSSIFKQNDLYTSEDLKFFLTYHKFLRIQNIIKNPYYYFSADSESQQRSPFFDQVLETIMTPNGAADLRIKVGTLSSYLSEHLAAVIHDQTAQYVKQKTMGNFPEGNEIEEKKLAAVMIDGFSDSDVYVTVALHYQNGKYKPLSSAKLVRGNSSATVAELNKDVASKSVLPTLSALQIDQNNMDLMVDFATLREDELWCASRLFSNPIGDLHLHVPRLSSIVSAYCPQAVDAYYRNHGGTKPIGIIYDTHLQSLFKNLNRLFDCQLVASDGEVKARQLVLDSVLHYHYDGLANKLIVAYFNLDQFLQMASSYLEKHDLPQIIDRKYA